MTGEPHIPETLKIFLGVSSLEANKPMKGLELQEEAKPMAIKNKIVYDPNSMIAICLR